MDDENTLSFDAEHDFSIGTFAPASDDQADGEEQDPSPETGAPRAQFSSASTKDEWPWPYKDAFPNDNQAREANNRALARAMRNGDQKAREKLIVQNIGLVLYHANTFLPRTSVGMSPGDLCSEGTIGLIKAIDKFDPDGDKPFSAIAGCWIKQAIGRAIVTKAPLIALPERIQLEISRIRYAEKQLKARFPKPSTEQIVDFLNSDPRTAKQKPVTAERVRELQRLDQRPQSIHAPVGNPDEGGVQLTLGDTIAADDMSASEEFEHKYMWEQLMAHLASLPEREQYILKAWSGFDDAPGLAQQRTTLDDIARKLGITRQRVQELRNRALKKLSDLLWKED